MVPRALLDSIRFVRRVSTAGNHKRFHTPTYTYVIVRVVGPTVIGASQEPPEQFVRGPPEKPPLHLAHSPPLLVCGAERKRGRT